MANSTPVNRESVTQALLKGKRVHKLTFAHIATAIGRNKVYEHFQVNRGKYLI